MRCDTRTLASRLSGLVSRLGPRSSVASRSVCRSESEWSLGQPISILLWMADGDETFKYMFRSAVSLLMIEKYNKIRRNTCVLLVL